MTKIAFTFSDKQPEPCATSTPVLEVPFVLENKEERHLVADNGVPLSIFGLKVKELQERQERESSPPLPLPEGFEPYPSVPLPEWFEPNRKTETAAKKTSSDRKSTQVKKIKYGTCAKKKGNTRLKKDNEDSLNRYMYMVIFFRHFLLTG